MAGELILVVDDEQNIIQLTRLYLEREGFKVEATGDGLAALQAVAHHKPALMILDIMLPSLDGLEVCRRLRTQDSTLPIVMLTARDDDIDKIVGLELGADDYLTKPFNPRELVARVKAVLRRNHSSIASTKKQPIHLANIVIDPASREVYLDDQIVPMRTQEFDLLFTLAEHRGIVLSREQLLEKAWGFDYLGQSRTVDVHIGHLRRKLAGSKARIETITGVGYKLVEA